MNEMIYIHQSKNNKASLMWLADKHTHYCLHVLKHELLYSNTSYELKWVYQTCITYESSP